MTVRACFTTSIEGSIPIHVVSQKTLDGVLAGPLAAHGAWLKSVGFSGGNGKLQYLPSKDGGVGCVVFGVGKDEDPFAMAALPGALTEGVYHIETAPETRNGTWQALAWAMGTYKFNRYKQKDSAQPGVKLVWPKGADQGHVLRQVHGLWLARDLINTPANDMGPAELAKAAEGVATEHGASFSTIEGQALIEKNYPMIWAVGAGSSRLPRLVDMRWGNAKHPKVTLVGKGVCFDSGGLDIKPSSGMLTMKKDMGGAACVLGIAHMVMDAKLPVSLRVLIPAVENSISGDAYRPGDVLKSRKGLTVEVGNTDAEGRLVLADALAEADSEAPELLICMATLTGAARVATGFDLPPFFSTDDTLASQLQHAAETEADAMWRFPLWRGYRDLIDSKVADLTNNPGSPNAGAITAALFLQCFVEKAKAFAHFDIAAWNDRLRPGRPLGAEAQTIRAIFAMLRARYAKG